MTVAPRRIPAAERVRRGTGTRVSSGSVDLGWPVCEQRLASGVAKPLTKLTWDNAALMSPQTAQRLGLKNDDVVELRYRERSIAAPVWVVPGHADDSVCVHFGYGRQRGGQIADGTGFDAYAFRTSDQPWGGLGLEMKKTGRRLHSWPGHRIITAWKAGRLSGLGGDRRIPERSSVRDS